MSRTVLVTGGNRGIGQAVAGEFAAAGYRVAVTHRGTWHPTDTAGVLGVRCDVTDPDSVDAAFTMVEAELGQVEIMVANAGITDDMLLLRMSDEQFTSVLNTNLAGAFRCAKRAAPKMLRARWGRMIFIASTAAMMGAPGQVNYAASKSGLIGLARSVTRELAGRNITANVVTPGFTNTDMTASLPTNLREQYVKAIPAGRFAEPADIAAVVTWLASDAAGYVTGAIIPVDGGLGMGH